MELYLKDVVPHKGMVIEYELARFTVLDFWVEDGGLRLLLEGFTGATFSYWRTDSMKVLPAMEYAPAFDFTISEMAKCELCGEYFNGNELTVCDDGYEVCEDCRDENYGKCDDCGKYYRTDQLSDLSEYDGRTVCNDCLGDHYTRCTRCEEWVHVDDQHFGHGDMYCEYCFGECFTTCDRCGETVRQDDTYYYEQRDETLCEYCWDERDSDEDDHLHSHGSELRVCFHDDRDDYDYNALSGTMYYGMELEMECRDGSRDSVAKSIEDSTEEDWYLEEDGSLNNGIEVIAHARTFESWNDFWGRYEKNILRPAREAGCTGHDAGTCGIHIHTSINAWDNEQLFSLFSLLYDKRNFEHILTISQRKADNLTRWASLSIEDIGKYKDKITKKERPFDNRYSALNITSQTLEFRIFNSSLRLDRVRKNMEFVHALYCYTKTVSRATWRGLMCWVSKNKRTVPYLYDFLKTKSLLEDKKQTAIAA